MFHLQLLLFRRHFTSRDRVAIGAVVHQNHHARVTTDESLQQHPRAGLEVDQHALLQRLRRRISPHKHRVLVQGATPGADVQIRKLPEGRPEGLEEPGDLHQQQQSLLAGSQVRRTPHRPRTERNQNRPVRRRGRSFKRIRIREANRGRQSVRRGAAVLAGRSGLIVLRSRRRCAVGSGGFRREASAVAAPEWEFTCVAPAGCQPAGNYQKCLVDDVGLRVLAGPAQHPHRSPPQAVPGIQSKRLRDRM